MKLARRLALPLALFLVALTTFACYTLEPVHERLEIRIGAGERATIVVETRIEAAEPDDDERGAALQRRLARLRSDLESGQDDWSRLLAPERSRKLRVSHEWEDGALSLSRREADCGLDAVPELFRGTDVEAWLQRGEGWTELNLLPLPPTRATAAQRKIVEDSLARFADADLRYVRALGALYAWLDEHPDRAEPAFARLLNDPAAAEEGDDAALVREANASMEALADFFFLESGRDGYSLDGLTRLAMDAFPAEVTLALPAPALEREGFELLGDGRLRVPEVSLWAALRSLQGRWIEPDVAVVALDALMRDGEPDLAALAGEPRRIALPGDAGEVRDALSAALAPRGPFRARWATQDAQLAEPTPER